MIAQARLGPGRIHHCMRAIGAAERALEEMCRRAVSRVTFGQPLATRGNIQDWIAESRIEIEMARLLTLKAAWMMDTVGNRHARTEIAAIKVAAPNVALKVLDRAIQVHGGGGVSDDFGARVAPTRTCARCVSPTAPTRCTSSRSRGASSRRTCRASAVGERRLSALVFRERPAAGEPQGLLILHHGRGADEHDLLTLADVLDPARRLHVVDAARAADAAELTGLPLVSGAACRLPRPRDVRRGLRSSSASCTTSCGSGPGSTPAADGPRRLLDGHGDELRAGPRRGAPGAGAGSSRSRASSRRSRAGSRDLAPAPACACSSRTDDATR